MDWPGTFGIRASIFRDMDGYEGNVLFENLDPPTARRFWSQRVRQAYDEFSRPWLLALWLAIIPTAIVLAVVAPHHRSRPQPPGVPARLCFAHTEASSREPLSVVANSRETCKGRFMSQQPGYKQTAWVT